MLHLAPQHRWQKKSGNDLPKKPLIESDTDESDEDTVPLARKLRVVRMKVQVFSTKKKPRKKKTLTPEKEKTPEVDDEEEEPEKVEEVEQEAGEEESQETEKEVTDKNHCKRKGIRHLKSLKMKSLSQQLLAHLRRQKGEGTEEKNSEASKAFAI